MAFDLAAALALKPVSKLDTTEAPVQMVALDLIDPHPDNFFAVEDDITDLAESIELNGLLQPLVVTPAEDGRYRTIAGHRRRKALLQLAAENPEKWQRVPCMVTHPASPELEELALIQTNTEAREIGWNEKNKAATRVEEILVKLQKEQGVQLPGKMRTHVAKIIKASESQIARAKFIAKNLIKPLQQKGVNDSVAYKLAHLPAEQQKELYDHYKNELWRLSMPTIKAYEENIAAGKDPFSAPVSTPVVRECYVQKMDGNNYKKCDHGQTIDARKHRDDLPEWQRCQRTCCSYCDYKFDCDDVCRHCGPEISKARKTDGYALGQRLRGARELAGLSVKTAAEKMGLSFDWILSHETLGGFSLGQMVEYCEAYGCTPNDIFGFADSKAAAPTRWSRLHLDATPDDGQLCQILVFDDNPIAIDGKTFCTVRAARWNDGRFVSALNDQVIVKGNLVGWAPLPEPPEGYTLSLGRIDGLKEGDADDEK